MTRPIVQRDKAFWGTDPYKQAAFCRIASTTTKTANITAISQVSHIFYSLFSPSTQPHPIQFLCYIGSIV